MKCTRALTAAVFLLLGLNACVYDPYEPEPAGAPIPAAASKDLALLTRQVVAAQEQSARLEVLLSQSSKQTKRLATEVRRLQARQSRLEEAIAKLRRDLASARRRSPSASSRPSRRTAPASRPRARKKAAAPRTRKSARSPSKPPASSYAVTPQEAYNRAYRAVRENRGAEATLRFRNFLKRFPKSRLAGNAQYWLGESYYDRKEYLTALVEFEKTITRYPKSRKVPAAFYKRGLTFLRMRDPRRAALEFEKLMDRFPKHNLTLKARAKLKSLNLSGNRIRR
ncbi:MAG: tol-pal system protein YbgF [bacterium]